MKNRIGILGELFQFLWRRKLWWMIPIVLLLVLCGVIIASGGSSPLAPIIYTMF